MRKYFLPPTLTLNPSAASGPHKTRPPLSSVASPGEGPVSFRVIFPLGQTPTGLHPAYRAHTAPHTWNHTHGPAHSAVPQSRREVGWERTHARSDPTSISTVWGSRLQGRVPGLTQARRCGRSTEHRPSAFRMSPDAGAQARGHGQRPAPPRADGRRRPGEQENRRGAPSWSELSRNPLCFSAGAPSYHPQPGG